MGGSNYLLDTVIVVGYFNQDALILQKFKGITFYIPSIVVGELYFGAYNSGKVASNIKQLKEFVAHSTILSCDEITGDYYGQVKRLLRTKGRPIPENDIWIASISLQYGLTLATRDVHFTQVDNLQFEMWI